MGLFSFLFGKKNKSNNAHKIKSPTVRVKSTQITELALPEEPTYKVEKKTDATSKAEPMAAVKEKKTATKKAAAKKSPPEHQNAANLPITETKKDFKPTRGRGRFEIKKTKDDRYVFNLYASNHVIIATSQIYSSTQSALTGIKSVMANADKAVIEDQTTDSYTKLPYPKWEMYIDGAKQYRFRLSAPNGSCICHSQGYTKKSSCKNGIESIKKFAKDAQIDKAYLKKD